MPTQEEWNELRNLAIKVELEKLRKALHSAKGALWCLTTSPHRRLSQEEREIRGDRCWCDTSGYLVGKYGHSVACAAAREALTAVEDALGIEPYCQKTYNRCDFVDGVCKHCGEPIDAEK